MIRVPLDVRSGLPMGCSIHSPNSECFCITLDDGALRRALQSELDQPDVYALIEERCPNLFSAGPVFITETQRKHMADVIRAVASVVALPAYREAALARAPAIARHDPGGALGVFFGYDFHVAAESFGLIEINTNAGGAMLNAVLMRAQRACCPGLPELADEAEAMEQAIMAMFHAEWQLSGRTRPLRSIAIIDEAPRQQFLYPDMLLFQQLFQRHGLLANVVDPTELTLRDGAVYHNGNVIDLLYNRLTDFYLEDPANAVIREAYLTHAVVLTPHPQAHALYANKRNLTILTDDMQLKAMGVPEATREVLLAGVPHTELVDAANAERLWSGRRGLFFKPAAGFGSRAAYRGGKLTRRVWQEIQTGHYVAQALVSPGERVVQTAGAADTLKFDLRNYVYKDEVQSLAARLYQGQTTNFRTPGGGFAPVYVQHSDVDCATG